MIEVSYKIQDKCIKEFNCVGHADYELSNKLDVVCACCSSIVVGGLNNIKDIKNYIISIKKGNVKVKIKLSNNHDDDVLNTIIIQLKTLEKKFKKNLKVKKL